MGFDDDDDVLEQWYGEVDRPEYDYYNHDEEEEERRVESLLQFDRTYDPQVLEVDECIVDWKYALDDNTEPRELTPTSWSSPKKQISASARNTMEVLPPPGVPHVSETRPRQVLATGSTCTKCGKVFQMKMRMRFHWCTGVNKTVSIDADNRMQLLTDGESVSVRGHSLVEIDEQPPPEVPQSAWEEENALVVAAPVGDKTAARAAERELAEEAQAKSEARAEAKAAQAKFKVETDEMEKLEQARHWAQAEWELEQRQRRRVTAATFIQAVWRARPARVAFLAQRNAAVTAQRVLRASIPFLRRCVYKERRRVAAVAIQAWWRGRLVRSQHTRMHAAATLIQRRVRTWPDRDQFNRRRQILVVLQRRVRHHFRVRRAAARCIQRFMRRRWRRTRIATMATRLQALARGAMCRRPFLAFLRERTVAATMIQAMWRGRVVRRGFLVWRAAAVVIQAAWRRYTAMRRWRAVQWATEVLCRSARGALMRRGFMRWRVAATCIQAAWRGLLGRRAAQQKWMLRYHDRTVFSPAVIVLQRWVRGHQARRWCRVQMRLERKAAVTVQRMWRGVRCRRKIQPALRTVVRQRHTAAVMIQKYVRRWLTRRRVRQLLVNRLVAAVDVQRYARGWLARRRVQRLWEEEMLKWAHRAATTVQRYVRGSQVRARFRGFRMERARRRRREQDEREARLRSHYVSDSCERVQAEVAALVGLGGEDLSRRGEAAAALAQVTVKKDDAAARQLVASEGGVQPLVQLLQDALTEASDPDADPAAEAAALALCHLARSKELRSDISAAHGLQALVALLSPPGTDEHGAPTCRSSASLKNGMLALVNLATLEPNRVALRRARGVAMLAPYLKTVSKNRKVEGDSTAELSVRLLATLCNCKEREAEAARDQALESGLLPYLVDALALGVGHPSTGFALQALVKLLESSVENKEVWHDAGGILALVRLLEKAAACGDTVLAGRAVMALLNASSNSKTNKAAVVLEGGVDLALWILHELVADTTSVAVRDPPLASDVVLLLRNLVTESSASQTDIVDAGVVPLLMRLIRRAAAVASGELVSATQQIDPKASEAHQRVVRSALNCLNSVLPAKLARAEAQAAQAALHLVSVIKAAQARDDKVVIKFCLQAMGQLAADSEEDWLVIKEYGLMVLLERNLGRAVARPPSKETAGGWFGRSKKTTAESEVPQQEMRRLRSERTHQRLVKAKDKGGRESSKWANETQAHRAKTETDAKAQAVKEEQLNKDREQSLARILAEERKTESVMYDSLRAEAMKRTELLERRAKLMAGKKWHKREMDELCRNEEEEMRQWRKEERLKHGVQLEPEFGNNGEETNASINKDGLRTEGRTFGNKAQPLRDESATHPLHQSIPRRSEPDSSSSRPPNSTAPTSSPPPRESKPQASPGGQPSHGTPSDGSRREAAKASTSASQPFSGPSPQSSPSSQYTASPPPRPARPSFSESKSSTSTSRSQAHWSQDEAKPSPSPKPSASPKFPQQQPPQPPPRTEAEDPDHPHECARCGHKFKHRIRLQLHWCAGLEPDEANVERGAQEEAQRRELHSQVEAKQRGEQERKQLWANLLQVAEDEENRRRAGITARKEEEPMTEKDKGELREVIVSLISESIRGLDKVGVMRAFRLDVGSGGVSELKLAYRRAAIRYHPDKNRNVGIRQRIFAEEVFKAISQKMESL